MVRITLLGRPIPQLYDSGSGGTVGDAIKALGGDPGAGALSVDGKHATADTVLQPGESVRQSPLGYHG